MKKAWYAGDAGSSTVETGLSCVLLLSIVFGIFELSLILYRYHFVSEAARLGTRYAMVHGSSCTGCVAAASDVQNYVLGLQLPGVDSSKMTVTTTFPTTGSACTPSSNPCNNPGNLVRVTVQYSESLAVPFLATKNFTVSSSSQMVISN